MLGFNQFLVRRVLPAVEHKSLNTWERLTIWKSFGYQPNDSGFHLSSMERSLLSAIESCLRWELILKLIVNDRFLMMHTSLHEVLSSWMTLRGGKSLAVLTSVVHSIRALFAQIDLKAICVAYVCAQIDEQWRVNSCFPTSCLAYSQYPGSKGFLISQTA
jgi:hypothetical protein